MRWHFAAVIGSPESPALDPVKGIRVRLPHLLVTVQSRTLRHGIAKTISLHPQPYLKWELRALLSCSDREPFGAQTRLTDSHYSPRELRPRHFFRSSSTNCDRGNAQRRKSR